MLEAQGLTLRLGGVEALRGVDLTLRPGELLAVVGPNGAGKSSLLGCLSGAIRPTSGSVRIEGADPSRLAPAVLARMRAVLEQSPESAAPWPLETLVALGIPREIAPGDAAGFVARAIEAVGLSALRHRRVDRLSGGERHRAHMARALAQHFAGRALGRGGWLLLDEPTASLDLAHQGAALRAAKAAATGGAGVLAVLHDLTLAAQFADRVAVMQAGRVIACGPPESALTEARLAAVYGLPVVRAHAEGAVALIPIHTREEGRDACS